MSISQEHKSAEETTGKNEKGVSRNEYDYAKTLPIRSIKVSDVTYQAYYDEENLTVYICDAHGEILKKGRLKKALPPIEENTESPEPESVNKEQASEDSGETQKRITDGQSSKKLPPKKMAAFIGVCIVVIITVCVLLPRMFNSGGTGAGISGTDKIQLIKLNTDAVPGTEVTGDIIEPVSVSSETYNQMSVGGQSFYKWDNKDSIIGMFITEYLQADRYITTNSVANAYEPKANPWGTNSGSKYVDIPIDIEKFDFQKIIPGQNVSLKIVVEKEEETMESDGTKTVITKIKNYEIPSAPIANTFSDTEDNLYKLYYSMMAVPAGDQYKYIINKVNEEEDFLTSVTPVGIRIGMTDEYAKLYTESNTNITTDITVLDSADISSEDKQYFYTNASVLAKSLSEVAAEKAEQNSK